MSQYISNILESGWRHGYIPASIIFKNQQKSRKNSYEIYQKSISELTSPYDVEKNFSSWTRKPQLNIFDSYPETIDHLRNSIYYQIVYNF